MRPWTTKTWWRIAINAWIVLAVAASIKTIIEPRAHTVYTAFSHGSRDWWDGHSLYFDRAYYYSPTFAVLVTPFAVWSDTIGGVLWGVASIGLLAYSLRVFYRDVLAESHAPSDPADELNRQDAKNAKGLLPVHWEPWFHLLVLFASMRSIWSGQSNAILVAFVLLAAAAIVRRQWWRAAWLLATPAYIKIWPIVAGGLFAVQQPRRLAARLAVAMTALGLIPFLTKAPAAAADAYVQWFTRLADRQTDGFRFPGYRDAWTIWEQIHTPVNPRAFLLLQLTAGLATLGWCLWQRGRGHSARQLAIYTVAAWSVWQLLFGPGTERLTYNIIGPALAWAILAAFHQGRGRVWIVLTFATTFVLGLGGMERLLVGILPAATALEPIGILMFVGWLVWHANQSRRVQSEAIIIPPLGEFAKRALRAEAA